MSPKLHPLARWVGLLVVTTLAAGALLSLVPLLSTPNDSLILQGPAAVDPDLEAELAVLFEVGAIATIQKVLHALGLTVFVGLAIVVIAKGGISVVASLASITLASLGTSLFAPLDQLPGGHIAAIVIGSLSPDSLPRFWSSLTGLALLGFLSVFPDGRWSPTWTRYLVAGAGIIGVATIAFPMGWADPVAWPTELQAAWLVSLPAAVVTAQAMRRRSGDPNRETRPVIVSLVAALAAFVLLWAIQPELTPGALDLVVVTPRLRAVYALNLLVVLSIAVFLFPVSVAFSIVRYRLFDVDLLINRAIVYGGATALVGLSFLSLAVGITALANGGLTDAVSGRVAGPIGVGVGVGVVLVFQPLRRRVQLYVDRRFYRERYDAQQVIDRFSGEMTQLISPVQLERGLTGVVDQALRPTSVRLHTGPFSDLAVAILGTGRCINKVGLAEPILPDTSTEERGGVLVPLLAGGSLTGVLDLGERASGSRYSKLDLNLLDRLARTAGPALQLAHEVELRERRAKEQERAAGELDLARRIQQGLLPKQSPELEGWSFDAFYQPAREVGGDFYDWLQLPDNRLGIVIGDVSDKGIPAALVMATCRSLIRSAAGTGTSPGALLASVNNSIQADIPAGMFVTCLVAYLDPADGSIEMANAGHNLPFVCSGIGTEELMVRGMPLGLMADMVYEEVSATVPPLGSLVLTSDGLAESHDHRGDMFGTGRLQEALLQPDGELLESALAAHRSFVGSDWEQEDDMTLVTVTRSSREPIRRTRRVLESAVAGEEG